MKKVLFVCLGNICRSPAAEGVMRHLVAQNDLHNDILIDSAGTSAYHVGSSPDSRMSHHASLRGYQLNSCARQFDPVQDFDNFDYIITMDESNFRNVKAHDRADRFVTKVFQMVNFCTVHEVSEVPDPYYDGEQGFELVMDIVEDACQGLLERIQKDLKG